MQESGWPVSVTHWVRPSRVTSVCFAAATLLTGWLNCGQDIDGCADAISEGGGALGWLWAWLPASIWLLISLIGFGVLFFPSCIMFINFGSPAMKLRVLQLAREEGNDSPRLQNILVGLDLYLFGVLAALSFWMDWLRRSVSTWLAPCMSDAACKAAMVAAVRAPGSSVVVARYYRLTQRSLSGASRPAARAAGSAATTF